MENGHPVTPLTLYENQAQMKLTMFLTGKWEISVFWLWVEFKVLLFGDRAFSVAAPKQWNALPVAVRSSPTLDTFKSRLKTH